MQPEAWVRETGDRLFEVQQESWTLLQRWGTAKVDSWRKLQRNGGAQWCYVNYGRM